MTNSNYSLLIAISNRSENEARKLTGRIDPFFSEDIPNLIAGSIIAPRVLHYMNKTVQASMLALSLALDLST